MTAGQQVAVVARTLELDFAALLAAWPHIQRGEVPPEHGPTLRQLIAKLTALLPPEPAPVRLAPFPRLAWRSARLN